MWLQMQGEILIDSLLNWVWLYEHFFFEVANVYLVFFPLIPKAKQGSLFYFSTMHLFEPMFFGQYNIIFIL